MKKDEKGRKPNEFNARVKRQLQDDVNSICSRPDCRKITLGASLTKTMIKGNRKNQKVGQAAHINGATPTSARWEDLPAEYLKSYDNGIWLCLVHAKQVDDDEVTYPKELLLEWKEQALETAKAEVGTRMPNKDDGKNAVKAMFSGRADHMNVKSIDRAIKNVHTASIEELNNIDPNYNVEVVVSSKGSQYTIIPTTPDAGLTLTIRPGEQHQKYSHMIEDFIKHATEVEIPLANISIENAAIFECLTQGSAGNLTMSPLGLDGEHVVFLVDPQTKEEIYCFNIDGQFFAGTESHRFEGSYQKGLFVFGYSYASSTTDKFSHTNATLKLDYTLWNSNDVKQLKAFKKIYDFFDKLQKGFKLKLISSINGEDVHISVPISLGQKRVKSLYLLYFPNYNKSCQENQD